MKLLLLLFTLTCAFAALTHKRDFKDAKENLSGIEEAVKKVKELHDYLESEEFQKIVKDIHDRILMAPEAAVKCFRESTDASKEDRDAIIHRLRQTLNSALKDEDEETTNPLQRLRNLVTMLHKILTDKDLQKDVVAVDRQYEEAVTKAFQCYEDEVNTIGEDIEKVVETIEMKFFGHKL